MKNRILIGIFFFLFVLTTSGVFAAMVGNSRQGLPAISVTSQPGSTENAAETHQGLTCVILNPVSVGAFISKDPIGFNGGNNLYRYADNNPIIYTDPTGFIGANQIHAMSFGSINNFFNSINESPSNPKSATLYPVTKSNMSGAVVPIDEVCDCGPFMVQRVSAKLYDTVWDPTYSSTNPVTHTPFTGANVWKSFESMNPSDFYVIGNNIYFPSPMWDFITLRIILRCVPPS